MQCQAASYARRYHYYGYPHFTVSKHAPPPCTHTWYTYIYMTYVKCMCAYMYVCMHACLYVCFITRQVPYDMHHVAIWAQASCFEGRALERGSGLVWRYRWPPSRAASRSGYRTNAPETSPICLQTLLVLRGKVHPSAATSPSLPLCTRSSRSLLLTACSRPRRHPLHW